MYMHMNMNMCMSTRGMSSLPTVSLPTVTCDSAWQGHGKQSLTLWSVEFEILLRAGVLSAHPGAVANMSELGSAWIGALAAVGLGGTIPLSFATRDSPVRIVPCDVLDEAQVASREERSRAGLVCGDQMGGLGCAQPGLGNEVVGL